MTTTPCFLLIAIPNCGVPSSGCGTPPQDRYASPLNGVVSGNTATYTCHYCYTSSQLPLPPPYIPGQPYTRQLVKTCVGGQWTGPSCVRELLLLLSLLNFLFIVCTSIFFVCIFVFVCLFFILFLCFLSCLTSSSLKLKCFYSYLALISFWYFNFLCVYFCFCCLFFILFLCFLSCFTSCVHRVL